jgi:hypothetical protein
MTLWYPGFVVSVLACAIIWYDNRSAWSPSKRKRRAW